MTEAYFPSGNPGADRSAAMAETMAHLGNMPAAIGALKIALDITPDWAAGWCRLGEYYEKLGRIDDALVAWERSVQADPTDPFGAGIKCDLIRHEGRPGSMTSAFVELLFDQYAPRFDKALTDTLGYQAPRAIAEGVRRCGITQAARTMDLGCGTGLCGSVLRPRTAWLEGVDLSARMLEEAETKGLYDRLSKADIQAMAPVEVPFDLITAADVFVYIGTLEKVLAWCAGALSEDGTLLFTIEQGESGCVLHEGRRYAHGLDYVTEALAGTGFAWSEAHNVTLRKERGVPVKGLTVTARHNAPDRPPETGGMDLPEMAPP